MGRKTRLFSGAYDPEAGRVAVKEGRAVDGADLAVAEEAAEGQPAEGAIEDFGIVVGLAVQVFAPADTSEQQGPFGVGGRPAFRVASQDRT